jgi:ATP-dependent RNA helicase DOB1
MMVELKTYEQQYDLMKIENEEEIARYYKLKKKLELVQDQMAVMMNEPKYLLSFLQPGRLITVRDLKISF